MLTDKQVNALCAAAKKLRAAGVLHIKTGDLELNLERTPVQSEPQQVVLLPGEPTVKDTIAEQSRRARAEAEELLYGVTL